MLATPNQQTGQQGRRSQYRDYGQGIAPHGTGASHSFAAGHAGKPGALTRGIVSPMGHGIAQFAGDIVPIVREGTAYFAALATHFSDLGGESVERIVMTTARREQIFKMHGVLPGYGRNAIDRTQVPYTIDDFGRAKSDRNVRSRMATT